MTPSLRAVCLAWISALGLAGLVALLLWQACERRFAARIETVGTLVVGTSLVRFAVPSAQGDDTLATLGPREFLRLGFPGGQERHVLQAASAAAEAGAAAIFIEVNPIVSRFANQSPGCGLRAGMRYERSVLMATAEALFRLDEDFWLRGGALPASRAGKGEVTEETLSLLYPLSLPGSCFPDAWRRLVEDHTDTRFAFLAMPRAPVARDRIGRDAMRDFLEASEAFAAATGAPLFIADPDGSWSAAHFLDQAHLNEAGSERFLRSFAQWWDEQP